MIIVLAGAPGIGKTSVAKELQTLLPAVFHIEMDQLRENLGATTRTNPTVEDAINWKAYELASDHLRDYPFGWVLLDSTGLSRRLPYLRTALADHDQKMVRLISSFAFAKCASKWGTAYTQAQFDHINTRIMSLSSDHTVRVDGKTAQETAAEIVRLCLV